MTTWAHTILITVRNEVAARLYFHRRLSVILFTVEGSCLSACWDTPPWQVHPPGREHPPPRAGTTPGQVHAGRYTPRQVHPSGQVHPPQRSLQRTVRILLECFLVCRFNSSFQRQTTVTVHTILKNLRIKIVPLGQAT